MDHGSLKRRILSVLAPLFGDKMAEGTLTLSCSSLKISSDAITEPELIALSMDLERRMAIFVGKDKAATIGRLIANLKGGE